MPQIHEFVSSIEFQLPVEIPEGLDILVRDGDAVQTGDILAKGSPMIIRELNLADFLQVKPSEVSRYLKFEIGDTITHGDIIARRKTWLGTNTVSAAYEGKLEELTSLGVLRIVTTGLEVEILADMDGVVSLDADRALSIRAKAQKLIMSEGIGTAVSGKVSIVDVSADDAVLHWLDRTYRSSVLIVRGVVTKVLWYKAGAMGVSAVIGYELDDALREHLSGSVKHSTMSLLLFQKDVDDVASFLEIYRDRVVFLIPERSELILPSLTVQAKKKKMVG